MDTKFLQPKGATIGIVKTGATVQQKFDSLDLSIKDLTNAINGLSGGGGGENIGTAWMYTATGGENSFVVGFTGTISSIPYIFVNGIRQEATVDFSYTPSTKTITLSSGSTLEADDAVTVIILDATSPTLAKLAQTTGAGLVGTTDGKTVQDKLDSLYTPVNVQDFMTDAQIASANSPTGTEDHSAAFTAAFATGAHLVFVPPVNGRYIVGDVTIPANTKLLGVLYRRPYDVATDASFNNSGSVIRKKSGATHQFLWNAGCTAEEIIFDGVDRTLSALESATGGKITIGFYRCGFYRWMRVGNKSGAYLGCSFQFCNFNQNNIGLYNTVDGNHIGCTFNANKDDGVHLEKGADSNTFTNCRNEWNGGNNWNFQDCKSIEVNGEICDRADGYGFFINGSSVNINGVSVRRNGRSAANDAASAHFYIETSDVRMTGVITSTGGDDAGGSVTIPSPQHMIRYNGAGNSSIYAVNCNLAGYLGTFDANATGKPTEVVYLGCEGIDQKIAVGSLRISDGRVFNSVLTKNGVLSAPATIAFTNATLGTTDSYVRTMDITIRDTTATGTSGQHGGVITFLIERNSGNAFVDIVDVRSKGNTIGTAAASTSQPFQVGITANTDATTLTLTVTGQTTDTKQYAVRAFLKS